MRGSAMSMQSCPRQSRVSASPSSCHYHVFPMRERRKVESWSPGAFGANEALSVGTEHVACKRYKILSSFSLAYAD